MKTSRMFAAALCCMALSLSAATMASAAENTSSQFAWEQDIEANPIFRGMYRNATGGEIYQYQYDRAFGSTAK